MITNEELCTYPLINLRVQYMEDSDPFNTLSVFPLPSRAPVFSFVSTTPLATQLGALLRLLGAPQRVSMIFFINCCITRVILVEVGEVINLTVIQ